MPTQEDAMLGGIFDSFSNMVKDNVALTVPLDSIGVDMNRLINDHIYGLLSLDELNTQQIALLAALLQTKLTED